MSDDRRTQIYNKYGGRCAYCGRDLGGKMDVDHIVPVMRGRLGAEERIKAAQNIDHLNPSCGRCNRYKSTMSLEDFRGEISKQVDRARKKSWNFRIAEDYGLITGTDNDVVFYFEKQEIDDEI